MKIVQLLLALLLAAVLWLYVSSLRDKEPEDIISSTTSTAVNNFCSEGYVEDIARRRCDDWRCVVDCYKPKEPWKRAQSSTIYLRPLWSAGAIWAADTGPIAPTSVASVEGGAECGTAGDDLAWSNASNAITLDTSCATAVMGVQSTECLQWTNFGFSLSGPAVVDGIASTIYRADLFGSGNLSDDDVKLIIGGTITGDNKAVGGTWPSDTCDAAIVSQSYGGAADLWGTTPTEAQVEASNFGLGLSVACSNAGGWIPTVNHMTVTVYYSDAPTSTPTNTPTTTPTVTPSNTPTSTPTPTPTPIATYCATFGAYVTCQENAYPPDFACGCAWLTSTYAARSLNAGTYQIDTGVTTWTTTPEGVITRAVLKIRPSNLFDVDNRSLTMDWFNHSDCAYPGDYSETAQTGAITALDLSELSDGVDYRILLDGPENIAENGATKARFHISGGQPTGNNALEMTNSTTCLELNFETYTPTSTPTETPTETPTDTPTETPTDTPTFTPTQTPTTTPTSTPTNTCGLPTNTPRPFEVTGDFQVNTYTTGNQRNPDVAWLNNSFVVVWGDAENEEIRGQLYDLDGVPIGSEFQVSTYIGLQYNPHVRADSEGDFVVVWTSYDGQDGEAHGAFGQRFDSAGSPIGTEFQANTYTTEVQINPHVEVFKETGDFLVTWASGFSQDGSQFGGFGQLFNSSGVKVGAEFQVNTYTTGSQGNVNSAAENNGNFVLTWVSQYQDGDAFGVFGRRYKSTGEGVGAEFQINTITTGNQACASSECLDVGSSYYGQFVVVWASDDSGDYNVKAQRFDHRGDLQGSEFLVNTYTSGDQTAPTISMENDGNFVVTWLSSNQDGWLSGIYAQRYLFDGTPVGTEFQVADVSCRDDIIGGSNGRMGSGNDLLGRHGFVWTASQLGDSDGSLQGIFANVYDWPTATPTLTPTPTSTATFTSTPTPVGSAIPSGSDDGYCTASDPSYPPSEADSCDLASNSLNVSNTLDGDYILDETVIWFDTSALDDDALLQRVTLKLETNFVPIATDAGALFVIEWYDEVNRPTTVADWSATSNKDALYRVLLSDLAIAAEAGIAENEFYILTLQLDNVTGINVTGYTGIRIHIELSGAPTGINEVTFSSVEEGTAPELKVYTDPPSDPTDWPDLSGATEDTDFRTSLVKIWDLAGSDRAQTSKGTPIHWLNGIGQYINSVPRFHYLLGSEYLASELPFSVRTRDDGILIGRNDQLQTILWKTDTTPSVSGRTVSAQISGLDLLWDLELNGIRAESTPIAVSQGNVQYDFEYELIGGFNDWTITDGVADNGDWYVPKVKIRGADGSIDLVNWVKLTSPNRLSFTYDDTAKLPSFYPYVIDPSTISTDAGTCVNDTVAFDGTRAWVNPDRAQSEDGLITSAVIEDLDENTDGLHCTGFGFAVPLTDSIEGVAITNLRYMDGCDGACSIVTDCVTDENMHLTKDGSATAGTNQADTVTCFPEVATESGVHGGAADLWGTTLTAAEVNAVTFGVINTNITTAGACCDPPDPNIDSFKVSVFYAPPTPTPSPTNTLAATPTSTPTRTPTPTLTPLGCANYDEVLHQANPDAHWRLGEEAAPDVTCPNPPFDDVAATAHTGAAYGGDVTSRTCGVTGALAGDSDTAFQSNGSASSPSASLMLDGVSNFSGTAISYGAWINTTTNSGTHSWLTKEQGGLVITGYNMGPTAVANEVECRVRVKNAFNNCLTTTSVTASVVDASVYDGNWHYVVCVYDGSLNLWIDGVLRDTSAASGQAVCPGSSVLHTHCNSDYSVCDDALSIDEVFIKGTTVTSQQILDQYNAGAHGCITPTPSPSPTISSTPTPTPTLQPTFTSAPTSTPTITPTRTATSTPTQTLTPSSTGTPTDTPTETPTSTPTKTPTLEPTLVFVVSTPDPYAPALHGSVTTSKSYTGGPVAFELVAINTSGTSGNYAMNFQCVCSDNLNDFNNVFAFIYPVTIAFDPDTNKNRRGRTGYFNCGGNCVGNTTITWRAYLDRAFTTFADPTVIRVTDVKLRVPYSGFDDDPLITPVPTATP